MELTFRHEGHKLPFAVATGTAAATLFKQFMESPLVEFGVQKMQADTKCGYEEVPAFFVKEYCTQSCGPCDGMLDLWLTPTDYILVKK